MEAVTSAEDWQVKEWREHEPWRLLNLRPIEWVARQDELFSWREPVVYDTGCGYFTSLPCSAGVYILYSGNEMLYIGKATSLAHRVGAHWMQGRIPFDRVAWVRLPVIAAEMLEAFFIGEHGPPHNVKFCRYMTSWHAELKRLRALAVAPSRTAS